MCGGVRCERCGCFRTVRPKSNIERQRKKLRERESIWLMKKHQKIQCTHTLHADIYGVNLIYIQQKSMLNNKLSNQFNVCNAYSGVLACVCVCASVISTYIQSTLSMIHRHPHTVIKQNRNSIPAWNFQVYISIWALMLPKFIRFGIVISILIREQCAFLVHFLNLFSFDWFYTTKYHLFISV